MTINPAQHWRNRLVFPAYCVAFFVSAAIVPSIVRLCAGRSRLADRCHLWSLKWGSRTILWLYGLELMATGNDLLPPDENFVVIANHTSWFDQIALLASSRHYLRFMVKADYFKVPGLAYVMRLHNYVGVGKGTERAAAFARAERLLRAGGNLVIYPEGTRAAGSELLPFQKGAFMLAESTGRRLLPVYIAGAGSALPKASRLSDTRRGTTLTVHWGKPFAATNDQLSAAGLEQLRLAFAQTLVSIAAPGMPA